MAFNISYNLIAIDRFSSVLNKFTSQVQRVSKSASQPFNRMSQSMASAGRRTAQFSQELQDMSGRLSLSVTGPIALAGQAALSTKAQVERMEVAYNSLLGSQEKSMEMMKILKDFASKTPFDLSQFDAATRTLLGMGIEAKKIPDTLKDIGDVAAGIGRPFNDVALFYGQVVSKKRLMAEELMSFQERGIPILEALAKGLYGSAKATDKVRDAISKGAVSSEIFQQAWKKMSQSQFTDQMIKQADALGGRWDILKGKVFLFNEQFGQVIDEAVGVRDGLKSAAGWTDKFTQKLKSLSEESPIITKIGILLVGALAVAGPLLFVISGFALAFGMVLSGLGLTLGAFALLAAKIGIIIAMVGGFIYIGDRMRNDWTGFMNDLDGVLGMSAKQWDKFFMDIGKGINNVLTYMDLLHKRTTQVGQSIGAWIYEQVNGTSAELAGIAPQRDITSPAGLGKTEGGFFTARNQSSATIDVNINDPGGKVADVKARQEGDYAAVNVGTGAATTGRPGLGG